MGNPPSSGQRMPRPGGQLGSSQALASALLHWFLEEAIESQQPTQLASLHPPDEADDIMQEAQNDHLGVSSVVIQETPSWTIGGIEFIPDAPQLLCNPYFWLYFFCKRMRSPPGSCTEQKNKTRALETGNNSKSKCSIKPG